MTPTTRTATRQQRFLWAVGVAGALTTTMTTTTSKTMFLLETEAFSVQSAFPTSTPHRVGPLWASSVEESRLNGLGRGRKAVLDGVEQDEVAGAPPPQEREEGVSLTDRIANSGAASAAAMATAAVNAAVAMRTLEAPNVAKSYVSLDQDGTKDPVLDDEGLPLVYDKVAIERYWKGQRGALQQRWSYFVSKAVPFLTKITTLFIAEGKIQDRHIPGLSRQARQDLQDLGPTFIKAGQMMSVRPDVLPQATLDELTKLQDAVVPFDTDTAIAQIERELGGPLGQFFSSISREPVAAASLAQVYKATLASTGEAVAVKVQRPHVLATVSKDLYVLRRAAEVFQGLVERFAPQQRTNYVSLLNEWAIGFYTELDFQNEGRNQERLRQALLEYNMTQVVVPRVHEELCTRRILVSEWMDGTKLSECTPEEIAAVTPAAQEAFLTQLFEVGFFHADPHPGNLLRLHTDNDSGPPKVALIDCGLMAKIDQTDRDYMISAVVHLANGDYASLVDDFMRLGILPPDSDRAAIIPLMDKALSPYVRGGGAKRYEEELRKLYGMQDRGNVQAQVGGFQAMTQDALTVLNDVPFSIPPYFAILGRAIVTLEGVALTGNPDFGLIMESYPFIARKLLREDRAEISKALQEVLYNSPSSSQEGTAGKTLTRLLALLNNAAGAVQTQEGAAFVDLDAIPEQGLSLQEGLQYLLSDGASSLRRLLEEELENVVDILSRQLFRKGASQAIVALSNGGPLSFLRPPALLANFLPTPPPLDEIPLPLLLPRLDDPPRPTVMTLQELINRAAPPLSREEELYALSLADAAGELSGNAEWTRLLRGDNGVWNVQTAQLALSALMADGGGAAGPTTTTSDSTRSSSSAVVDAVLETVQNLWQSASFLAAGGGTAASSASNNMFQEWSTAISQLNPEERSRFDAIVQNLALKGVEQTLQRLSGEETPAASL